MSDASQVAEMLVRAHATVHSVTQRERAALRIVEDADGLPPAPVAEVRSRPGLKIQAPRTLPEESEVITDDQLVDLTLSAIEDRYRKKWLRLDASQKRDRVGKFADEYCATHRLSPADRTACVDFLVAGILNTKSVKGKDIEYDEARGAIAAIPRLQRSEDGLFSLGKAASSGSGAARPRSKKAPVPTASRLLAAIRRG